MRAPASSASAPSASAVRRAASPGARSTTSPATGSAWPSTATTAELHHLLRATRGRRRPPLLTRYRHERRGARPAPRVHDDAGLPSRPAETGAYALPGTLGVSLCARRPILSPSQTSGSYLRPTTRSFIGMMALSVILMCSGHTSVQHLVMLQ